MFLPAQTPYERQVLIEHVTSWARSERLVQVLEGRRRWHFRIVGDDNGGERCTTCDRPRSVLGEDCARRNGLHCVGCALGDGPNANNVIAGEPLAA